MTVISSPLAVTLPLPWKEWRNMLRAASLAFEDRYRRAQCRRATTGLRRCHLRTDLATRLPLLLHLAKLMEEYVN